MPNNFEVGDVVRCIESSVLGTLVKGNTYRITFVDEGPYVSVADSESSGCSLRLNSYGWHQTRFELVTKYAPKLTGMTQFYKDRKGVN
jgi:hypothetical protein